ncbi:MAG: NAD-dependent epimerase/dehydratase family protein [Salinibacterium sp.]|nr:NAD-dependent epimerase/dehydratase family protein [Salinibacterium sp.]
MADCIVIGANGFLGSSLTDALVERGHAVTAFDRFSGPERRFTSKPAIIEGDFLDRDAVSAAVAGQGVVFHFLSTTTPATADNDPARDVLDNLAPSIDLFSACVAGGVRRVVFASTGGAIYGEKSVDSVTEDLTPEPISPYAIGKLAIEGYLAYFRRKHGLESTSFRISNPYGPRQRSNRAQGVIPTFLERAAKGEPVPVYGDGSSVRDYVYVDDAIRMIVDTVDVTPQHAVYNIGSGVGTSLAELLAVIGDVTGSHPTIDYQPEPATFVHRSVLDTSRYREEFGTAVARTLREGIGQTWTEGAGA